MRWDCGEGMKRRESPSGEEEGREMWPGMGWKVAGECGERGAAGMTGGGKAGRVPTRMAQHFTDTPRSMLFQIGSVGEDLTSSW